MSDRILFKVGGESSVNSVVIRSLGERRLHSDPYQAGISQYRNEKESLLRTAKFYHNIPPSKNISEYFKTNFTKILVDAYHLTQDSGCHSCFCSPCSMPFSRLFFTLLYGTSTLYSFGKDMVLKYRDRNLSNQAQASALSSVDIILTGLKGHISNHIRQTLCKELNNISEDIRRRKAKLSERKATDEARLIARFIKENTSAIVQLYLNLLDKTNRFEYSLCDTDRTYSENIAATRVPRSSFTWQEVRYMNELKHENIIRYYGIRKSENTEDHYDIFMQRLDSDLTQYIDYASRKGKISDRLMDDIFRQITSGLAYLHQQGLIHRDIKPENVLVQPRKEQPPVFILTDFDFIHREPISIKGTPGFLAPELLVDNTDGTFITAKIDIFALGTTIQQTAVEFRVSTSNSKQICCANRSHILFFIQEINCNFLSCLNPWEKNH